jgi:hypothetical protein
MSDFLINLLNRHLGIGDKVLPRIRTRFEPDAMVTFFRQDAPGMAAIDTSNYHDERESSHHKTSTVTSSKNDERTKPAHSPLSEAHINIDNKEFKKKLAKSENPDIKLAEQRANGLKKMTPDMERSEKKDIDNKVFSTPRRVLSPDEKDHSVKSANPDKPVHIVTTDNQKGSHSQQCDHDQTANSKPPIDLSVNLMKTESHIAESQPDKTAAKTAQNNTQGMLETPNRVFDQPGELRKRLVLKKSKVKTEPIVNVTIGCIEVRATQLREKKQSPQKREPSDIMSLDKYLSQCEQRGRR